MNKIPSCLGYRWLYYKAIYRLYIINHSKDPVIKRATPQEKNNQESNTKVPDVPPFSNGIWSLGSTTTWRIIPHSKWLVTPMYKPFRPFARGTTLLRGLTHHGTTGINHLLSGMIFQVVCLRWSKEVTCIPEKIVGSNHHLQHLQQILTLPWLQPMDFLISIHLDPGPSWSPSVDHH